MPPVPRPRRSPPSARVVWRATPGAPDRRSAARRRPVRRRTPAAQRRGPILGVVASRLPVHPPRHPLIAADLHIPPHPVVGQPDQWIEPMHPPQDPADQRYPGVSLRAMCAPRVSAPGAGPTRPCPLAGRRAAGIAPSTKGVPTCSLSYTPGSRIAAPRSRQRSRP